MDGATQARVSLLRSLAAGLEKEVTVARCAELCALLERNQLLSESSTAAASTAEQAAVSQAVSQWAAAAVKLIARPQVGARWGPDGQGAGEGWALPLMCARVHAFPIPSPPSPPRHVPPLPPTPLRPFPRPKHGHAMGTPRTRMRRTQRTHTHAHALAHARARTRLRLRTACARLQAQARACGALLLGATGACCSPQRLGQSFAGWATVLADELKKEAGPLQGPGGGPGGGGGGGGGSGLVVRACCRALAQLFSRWGVCLCVCVCV
jgi:hypothetical protein